MTITMGCGKVDLVLMRLTGAKCLNQVNTGGENISLTYSPEGNYVAVGTKVSQSIPGIPTIASLLLTTIPRRTQYHL